MAIHLDEIEYVEAVWFVNGTSEGNWMAWIYRKKGETDWTLTYRFRYYVDGKIHDSNDRWSWYEYKTRNMGLAKMVESTDIIANLNAVRFGGELDKTVVQGPPERALDLLSKKSWFHSREEPIN